MCRGEDIKCTAKPYELPLRYYLIFRGTQAGALFRSNRFRDIRKKDSQLRILTDYASMESMILSTRLSISDLLLSFKALIMDTSEFRILICFI